MNRRGFSVEIGALKRYYKRMKRTSLSTYEAAKKYGLSASYLRLLADKGVLKAEAVKVTRKRIIWLIQESSLKAFLCIERNIGRTKQES